MKTSATRGDTVEGTMDWSRQTRAWSSAARGTTADMSQAARRGLTHELPADVSLCFGQEKYVLGCICACPAGCGRVNGGSTSDSLKVETDISVSAPLKGAAKRDNLCELQNSVNQWLPERALLSWASLRVCLLSASFAQPLQGLARQCFGATGLSFRFPLALQGCYI